jgi:uncharacterized repeat protein (TIGR03843 family)
MQLPDGLTEARLLDLLATGDMQLEGQFLYGSNFTFLVQVDCPDGSLKAVYKPSQGERPLWDFPSGTLAAREAAAYQVSRQLGWELVPPTVIRTEGPSGPGSLQWFVDADPSRHYFTVDDADKERLLPAAVFDVLINNADRKGGHVLFDTHDHLWLIDHGVCFHTEPKLRTVIWDFAGEPIPQPLLADLQAFHDTLGGRQFRGELSPLLDPDEIDALSDRNQGLLDSGKLPFPGPGRHYPWPLI